MFVSSAYKFETNDAVVMLIYLQRTCIRDYPSSILSRGEREKLSPSIKEYSMTVPWKRPWTLPSKFLTVHH